MGVGDERVPQVGDPGDTGPALGRRRRRGGRSPGGEVVRTTSLRSRRTSLIAAGIAVTSQSTLASGTRSPRSASSPRRIARSRPCTARSSSAGRRARGPTFLERWTLTSGGATSDGSVWSHFGSSGARTCTSWPSAARWPANFSGRWTPAPPAGGQYIDTISKRTATEGGRFRRTSRGAGFPLGDGSDRAPRSSRGMAASSGSERS